MHTTVLRPTDPIPCSVCGDRSTHYSHIMRHRQGAAFDPRCDDHATTRGPWYPIAQFTITEETLP